MGGFADGLNKQLADVLHEQYAQAVAARMRELGRTDVENIVLEHESDDPSAKLDRDRVKARVREILQGE